MNIDSKNLPKHIAIIPDGNRRWAKNRGFLPWVGHKEGIKSFEKILERIVELKIPYITFWGSSWDNLTKRSGTEVKVLFEIFTKHFKRIAEDKRIHKDKVRVSVFGRWREILPKKTQEAINKAIKTTENYRGYFLTFLLAYNGADEMENCIQKIADNSKGEKTKITKELIKENLWTKDLPPVDLVIRTGCDGDPHNSTGFMMWDTAYSQFHFTKTFFPDFSVKEFEEIIKDYTGKERRRGA